MANSGDESDEDFNFRQRMDDEMGEEEQLELEQEFEPEALEEEPIVIEEEEEGEEEGEPRQEHLDSNITATTATTTEDEDEDRSMSTYPTPSSIRKQRIVELSRGEDLDGDEDANTSGYGEESFDQEQEQVELMERYSPEEIIETIEMDKDDHQSIVDDDDEEVQEEQVEPEWETLPTFTTSRISPHHHQIDYDDEEEEEEHDDEEEDEPVAYSRKTASDVDSFTKGSVERFERDQETGEPYQRDRTTTFEGWIAVRISQDQWQERYSIIQPAFGVFAFEDEVAAQDWRRSEEKSSYDARMLLSCGGLRINLDSDLSTEADEKTQGEYVYGITLSNDKGALVVMALPESTRNEWMDALEGARPVADYIAICEELEIVPIPSLVRMALSNPPLKSLSLKLHDLSDLDTLEAVCQLAMSTGKHLLQLKLENCNLSEDGALLIKDCVSRLPALQELDLSDNPHLGEDGMSALLSGIIRSHLRVLSLSNCGMRDHACLELSNLVAHSPSLERLDVTKNRISPLGGVKLATSLAHCPQLQALFCGDNIDLQDEFVSALASTLPAVPSLRELDLSRTRLTDWGLARLERTFNDNPIFLTIFECLDLRNNTLLSPPCINQFLDRCQFLKGVVLLPDGALQPPALLTMGGEEKLGEEELRGLQQQQHSMIVSKPEFEYSTCSRLLVKFGGSPVPTSDRIRDVVMSLTGLTAGQFRVIPRNDPFEMEIEVFEDDNESIAERIKAAQHQNKLKLLRVESIKILPRPSPHGLALQLHPSALNQQALVSTTTADGERALQGMPPREAVTLDVLSASISDALLESAPSAIARVERDAMAIIDTLSPLTRFALSQVVTRRVTKATIAAAGGMMLECDAAVGAEADMTGELDLLSLVQCSSVCGSLSKLRHSVSSVVVAQSPSSTTQLQQQRQHSEGMDSFGRRLGHIIARAYPQRLVPEQPLSVLDTLRDTSSRPLTRPKTIGSIEEYESHVLASERVFSLIQQGLGYEPRPDPDSDGTGALNELLGMCSKNPNLTSELHLDYALRTCLNDTSRSTRASWVHAVLALRCVPCKKDLDGRLIIALAAGYKRYYERSKDPMAVHAQRALEMLVANPEDYVFTHPLKRLDYLKQSIRRESCTVVVHLPDSRAVLVDCLPFSTFLDVLVKVDEALNSGLASSSSDAQVYQRWQGFNFIERGKGGDGDWTVLHMADDPHWWFHRTGKHLRLCLECIVPGGFFPLLSEADPENGDEHIRGDRTRVAMTFAQERSILKQMSSYVDDVACVAYCAVICAVIELGEDRFRACNLAEYYRVCETQFPLGAEEKWNGNRGVENATKFRDSVADFRAHLLTTPKGSLGRESLKAVLVNYARIWPLSGAMTFKVRPRQSCNGATVMDEDNLPKTALLTLSTRSGISLLVPPLSNTTSSELDFRSCMWSCDVKSLSRVEEKSRGDPCEVRIVVSGEEDWLVCVFDTPKMAKTFRACLLAHLWATLSHGGVILSSIKWLEEFSFRFPLLPIPPHPPRLAIPPGGLVRTKLPRVSMEPRLASQALVDYLLRPMSNNSAAPIQKQLEQCAFFYGPLELSDVVLTKSLQNDHLEAELALPPLNPPPPPPLGDVEYPLPLEPPPPLDSFNEQQRDESVIMRPPSHPPPPPDSPPRVASPSPRSPSSPPPTTKTKQSPVKTEGIALPTGNTETFVMRADSTVENNIPPPPTIVITAAPASGGGGGQEGMSEEEEKARRKREFLRKKREREQAIVEERSGSTDELL